MPRCSTKHIQVYFKNSICRQTDTVQWVILFCTTYSSLVPNQLFNVARESHTTLKRLGKPTLGTTLLPCLTCHARDFAYQAQAPAFLRATLKSWGQGYGHPTSKRTLSLWHCPFCIVCAGWWAEKEGMSLVVDVTWPDITRATGMFVVRNFNSSITQYTHAGDVRFT